MAKIKITETVLRDAQQSLISTRMTIDEMLPMLKALDKVGYYSVEVWGGSTFDTCLRYLNEDPWQRLRIIKKNMPKTKLQMVFRGQSLLGYRNYADDVVEYFVRKSIDNGIDILRVYDPLNDLRNLQTAIKTAKSCDVHIQGALCYATDEIYTIQYYVALAKQLENMGVDSICIKDMSSLLTPYMAYDLVKAIKKVVSVPIQLHTHYTSGMASMAQIKAAEAGVDMIDTAISPLAMGTSNPSTEAMIAALNGTPYETELNLKKLEPVREIAMRLRQKYLSTGQLNPNLFAVDTNILNYKMPISMINSVKSQLKIAGKDNMFEKVLEEIPVVRKEVGMPPLVTPISQIVGMQAVFNVITGARYGTVTDEFKLLAMGAYGQTPGKIDTNFFKQIVGNKKQITSRPADLIPDELDKFRRELPLELVEQEEDVLSFAQFGEVATKFFKRRRDDKYGIDSEHAVHDLKVHPA